MLGQKLYEECGVVGIIGDPDAANIAYLSLYALQHRGQEACGIVTCDEKGHFHDHKREGLVADAFTPEDLDHLPGNLAIGHVRYSTSGGRLAQNIQPFFFKSNLGPIGIAHNGNLTNASSLRQQLEDDGAIFTSTSDTEVFMHLIARSQKGNLVERISEAMERVDGAYSVVLMTADELYCFKDPHGFRPLAIGRRGDAVVVASETCALDLVEANYDREVKPGELVCFSRELKEKSYFYPHLNKPRSFCSFEPIYFARPDSKSDGETFYDQRKRLGYTLAEEAPAEGADVVFPVPDSGVPMAVGYSQASGVPFELGLIRNHYVGRTFIEPSQSIRDFGVKLKLNPVDHIIRGKRVVVIDDSIVRGTTSEKIIRMIRNAGAKEVHVRIGSPPITHSCYFGVDTPKRKKLLAAQYNVREICEKIGADSLAFLSEKGLKKTLNNSSDLERGYCYGCFSGKYPAPIHDDYSREPTDGSSKNYSYPN